MNTEYKNNIILNEYIRVNEKPRTHVLEAAYKVLKCQTNKKYESGAFLLFTLTAAEGQI